MNIITILKTLKNIINFTIGNNNYYATTTSNDRFMIKNNYGVEKDIILMKCMTAIYFIPAFYKKGIYKLNELPCLIYSVEELKKLSFKKKQKLFDKYSFWYKIGDRAFSNDFSTLYDENNIGIDNIEVSYIDLEDKKGILNRVSFPNSKNFFQHFDQDTEKLEDIVKKISKDATDSILEFIEKEIKNDEEIFRMFLDYYGDGEEINILFTVGTKDDYNNIVKKYSTKESLESSRWSVDEMKEALKDSSGDYCKIFRISNLDEIKNYYCSFAECGVTFEGPHETCDLPNNFLYSVGLSIKERLEKKIKKFNLSDDFSFLDPSIYD